MKHIIHNDRCRLVTVGPSSGQKNIILYFSSQNGSIYLTHFVSFIIMLWFAARSASPDLESFLKEQQQSEL